MSQDFFYKAPNEIATDAEIKHIENKIKEIDSQLELNDSLSLRLIRDKYKDTLNALRANKFFL